MYSIMNKCNSHRTLYIYTQRVIKTRFFNRTELRIFDKFVNGKAAALGVSYFFMKYDVFRQNAGLFKEWSVSS